MRFDQPLERGWLLRRYKRFLADVALEGAAGEPGREETVHVPNPGAMLGLDAPGSPVWLRRSFSPTRKLPLSLQIVEADGARVGVDTLLPNTLAAEMLTDAGAGPAPELAGYATVRREVRVGAESRLDFLLEDPARGRCWVEVKNCHLMRTPGLAEFPDCRAARSARHLRELTALKAAGDRAAVLFIVQRPDCDRFATADDIDPAFGAALREARAAGVELIVCGCSVTPEAITVDRRLQVAAPGDEP